MSKGYQKIGRFTIQFDEIYYIAYAGGTRDLPEKDMKEYKKAISIPWGLSRQQQLFKLPREKNPNVVPVKGIDLVGLIKELGFIPFFDPNFNDTHLIKLTDVVAYEAIKQKNYELALKKQ